MSRSSAAARQVMLLPVNTPQDLTFPPHVSYLRIKVLKDVHYPSILAILVTFVCIQKSLYLLQIRQDAVEIKHKHAALLHRSEEGLIFLGPALGKTDRCHWIGLLL